MVFQIKISCLFIVNILFGKTHLVMAETIIFRWLDIDSAKSQFRILRQLRNSDLA